VRFGEGTHLHGERERIHERTPAGAPGGADRGDAGGPPRSLGLGSPRRGDHLLYVPASYRARHPTPILVLLHGAGGERVPP
jgi:poly(3-hydroxybutyrate) depolymerase